MCEVLPKNIGRLTTAKDVREELARFSGKSEWTRATYWKYFLKLRMDIFDSIFSKMGNMADRDWTHPVTIELADQQFVEQAKLLWGEDPRNQWILQGDWLISRADIVSWLRIAYWKHHKYKWIAPIEDPGFLTPWNMADCMEETVAANHLVSEPTLDALLHSTLVSQSHPYPTGPAGLSEEDFASTALQAGPELASLATAGLLLLKPNPAEPATMSQGEADFERPPDGNKWMDVILQ